MQMVIYYFMCLAQMDRAYPTSFVSGRHFEQQHLTCLFVYSLFLLLHTQYYTQAAATSKKGDIGCSGLFLYIFFLSFVFVLF